MLLALLLPRTVHLIAVLIGVLARSRDTGAVHAFGVLMDLGSAYAEFWLKSLKHIQKKLILLPSFEIQLCAQWKPCGVSTVHLHLLCRYNGSESKCIAVLSDFDSGYAARLIGSHMRYIPLS